MKPDYKIETVLNRKTMVDYQNYALNKQAIALIILSFFLTGILIVVFDFGGLLNLIELKFRLPLFLFMSVIMFFVIKAVLVYIGIKGSKNLYNGYNTTYYFKENEFIITDKNGEGIMNYSIIEKVIDTPEYFYLSIRGGKLISYIIPKNSIEECERDNFKLFIEEKIS